MPYFFLRSAGTFLIAIVLGLFAIILIIYIVLKFFDFEDNPVLGKVTLECHHCHQQTPASHHLCQHCYEELQ